MDNFWKWFIGLGAWIVMTLFAFFCIGMVILGGHFWGAAWPLWYSLIFTMISNMGAICIAAAETFKFGESSSYRVIGLLVWFLIVLIVGGFLLG